MPSSSKIPPNIVVADTSVLINFLKIDRMDLIGCHPDRFVATDHVGAEITNFFVEQQRRYKQALKEKYIEEVRIGLEEFPEAIELFRKLKKSNRLGAGECSAIALALTQGYVIAMDDRLAINKALLEAGFSEIDLQVLRTQDIIIKLIQLEFLSIKQADAILIDWSKNHRFRLKISSFGELL